MTTTATTIQDLKKGDRFLFNHKTYLVRRRWLSDSKPLIAVDERYAHLKEDDRFHHEGLEVQRAEGA